MPGDKGTESVVALAGRRIDADGACEARFPLSAIPLVRSRLTDVLRRENARALVCSAACGADLIALEEARRLGLRRRVVLPFAPEVFLVEAVTDRPDGRWGSMFQEVVESLAPAGDLLVLGEEPRAPGAYAAANAVILEEAGRLAAEDSPARRLALVVWEGALREGKDATAGFRDLADEAGFAPREVLTH